MIWLKSVCYDWSAFQYAIIHGMGLYIYKQKMVVAYGKEVEGEYPNLSQRNRILIKLFKYPNHK